MWKAAFEILRFENFLLDCYRSKIFLSGKRPLPRIYSELVFHIFYHLSGENNRPTFSKHFSRPLLSVNSQMKYQEFKLQLKFHDLFILHTCTSLKNNLALQFIIFLKSRLLFLSYPIRRAYFKHLLCVITARNALFKLCTPNPSNLDVV